MPHAGSAIVTFMLYNAYEKLKAPLKAVATCELFHLMQYQPRFHFFDISVSPKLIELQA